MVDMIIIFKKKETAGWCLPRMWMWITVGVNSEVVLAEAANRPVRFLGKLVQQLGSAVLSISLVSEVP